MHTQATSIRALLAPFAIACLAGLAGGGAGAEPCGAWEILSTPSPDGSNHAIVRDIVAIAPDDVWAVGGYNAQLPGCLCTFAFAMHWDGRAWTFADVPQPAACPTCTNVTLWGVDATGPNDVWAAGHKNVQGPDGFLGTHILVMHYDGSSWEVLETPIQSGASGDILWDVEAIAPDNVWFFGENLYSGFPLLLDLAIALHWDGSSFKFVEVPIVNFVASGFGDGNSLHAGDALAFDDMWAVGAGGDGDPISCNLSQIHHWDGEEWTHRPSGPPDGCFWHSLDAVEMIAPDDVWAGGEYEDAGGFHGLALHWNGSNWSQVNIPIGVSDFVAFASNNVYAFGGGVAHWDGTMWTVVETFDEVFGPSLAGADAAAECEIFVGGRQIVGDILQNLTAHLIPNSPSSPADLDGDGDVDGFDLALLLGQWTGAATYAPCPPSAAADLNSDCKINGFDLAMLLAAWS